MLTDRSLHVWRIRLDGGRYADFEPFLSAAEREKADRCQSDIDRAEWAGARAALKRILAAYTSTPVGGISFAIGVHGKPSLAAPADIEFNLSHTTGVALAALTRANPCGVDVERRRSDIAPRELAHAVFAPDEIAAVASAAPGQEVDVFLRIWTRKEAWLKMLGQGLIDDISRFSLLDPASLPAGTAPGHLADVDAGEGVFATVAARHAVERIEEFDYL